MRFATLSVSGLVLLSIGPASSAYSSQDMAEIEAPAKGAIPFLVGYNSRTGQLMNTCVKKVTGGGPKAGANQPGYSDFRYTRSMEEVMSDSAFDYAAKAKIAFGVGSASVGVSGSFAEETKSRIEQGVAYAVFRDEAEPRFVDPAATFELTDQAIQWLEHTRRNGSKRFENNCGDSFVVGKHFIREFRGMAFFNDSSTFSASEREFRIKAAVSYMGSKVSGEGGSSLSQSDLVENSGIRVKYMTSGDYEGPGATNIKQFRRTFRSFSDAPLAQTRGLQRVSVIDYKDALPRSAFNLGLSRKQLRDSDKILSGALLIERAHSVAKSRRGGGAETRARMLGREMNLIRKTLSSQNGCLMREKSQACLNLLARFDNFPSEKQQQQRRQFVRAATSGSHPCPGGYPVSRPNGQPLCKPCPLGKEPDFRNGNEGRCRYVGKGRPQAGSTRLTMDDLKVGETVSGGEAGQFRSIASYPNVCDRPGADCRGKAAARICRDKGFAQSTGFQVWTPPRFLRGPTLRIHYKNGNQCRQDPSSFDRVTCRPFKYVDCSN